MAKYKVLHRFKDKETNKIHEPSENTIELTVKRADEINKKLGNFVERVDEPEKTVEE